MDADNQKQIDLCKNELRLYGICEINLLDLPLEYWTELVELVKFVKSHPLFKEIKIFAIKFLDDLIHTDIIAQVKKPDQNNIDDINEIKYPTIYLNPDMRQNVRFEKRLKNRTISKNNSFKSVVFHEMMHLFIIQLTMKQRNIKFDSFDSQIEKERYEDLCSSLDEQFSIPYTVFKDTFKGRLDEINLLDYQYAMVDYHEFFAEIFTAYYIRGDRMGQIVEYVENAEKYIRKYIMKQ